METLPPSLAARMYGVPVRLVYPPWRADVPELRAGERKRGLTWKIDDGEPLGVFDEVFICRSSAWMPPQMDVAFEGFVRSMSEGLRLVLDPDLSNLRRPCGAEQEEEENGAMQARAYQLVYSGGLSVDLTAFAWVKEAW